MSRLDSLIIQLVHDIHKRTPELTIMYQILVPRIVMEYSVFPKDVSSMILSFIGLKAQTRQSLPNIPFVRLNLDMCSPRMTSVDILINEYAMKTFRNKYDQKKLVNTTRKVVKFKSEKLISGQKVEYVRKHMYSTRVKKDNTICFLLKDHVVGVTVPIIMAYLGN
jgi:hypothetical protein